MSEGGPGTGGIGGNGKKKKEQEKKNVMEIISKQHMW